MLLAASCAKEEVNDGLVGEKELITVQLNPETKTALGAEGTTTWTSGDAVDVIVDGNKVGTLSLVEGSTFSGELTTVGLTGEATLKYPAGVAAVPAEQEAVEGSFANGAALLEGTVDLDVLRAGEGATLANKTALLQFSVAVAGDVVFTLGETTYTVTGCEADKTYYACVAPVENVALSYTVGMAPGANEKTDFAPAANKVYELGVLATLNKSEWAIVGSPAKFGSWAYGNSQYYFYELEDFYVAKDVPFAASDEFKFVKNGSDWRNVSTLTQDTWLSLTNSSTNLTLAAGNYDIYILKNKDQVYVTVSGSPLPEKPAVVEAKANYLYLNPSMWNVDGARFAAYFFDNGEKWVSMTDPDGDGIYEVEIQSGYPSVIFCRMNGGNTTNSWTNKWNQSGNLEVPTNGNNLFTPSAWDNATTTWTKVTEF